MIIGDYNPAGIITFSGLILSMAACILSYNNRIELAVACFIFAGLYILKISVPKPGGDFYFIFPLTGTLLSLFWIMKAMN